MLRFAASRSRGRVIAWSLLLATAAAIGLTRWIKASDHKDSALLAADHAADSSDLVQFKKIIAGQATSFRDPGVDSFAGTNVLAIALELPSALLGGTKLGVWGTTSRQQF